MKTDITNSVLERTRAQFKELVENSNLLYANVSVLAKQLTPEEAIGTPGRRDFPILIGKERVIESRVLESRAHAFTDSPREFTGTIGQVLDLKLSTNQSRAIYVATLNAVLVHLNMVDAAVHCRDDDPEICAAKISEHIMEKYGRINVGLIGLNPAIAEKLTSVFGVDHVLIADLNADNIGKQRFGVEVWDGNTRTEELVDASDLILFTGTTLVNGTFDRIWNKIQDSGKSGLVYGVTAAGVSKLAGIERICPCGRV